MLLERVCELDLLRHDPKSNVMAHFRCAIISQTNKYFLGDQAIPEQHLKSDAHIKFVMEIIGQSFSLPLYHLPIIFESVAVYKNWLLNASRIPTAVDKFTVESELGQEILQNVIMQLSNVFRPRSLGEMVAPITNGQPKPLDPDFTPLVNQHIDLCLIVSSFIKDIVESHHKQFSEETWVIVLKVVLAICDCMLGKLRNAPYLKVVNNEEASIVVYMGDKLCENLIQLLSGIWLQSQVTPKYMWAILKRHFVTWTQRNRIVKHWSDLSLQLTGKVMAKISMNIAFLEPDRIDSKTDDNRLYYTWYQIIRNQY